MPTRPPSHIQPFIALLQLIRLPNVLTAAADSLAGWSLGGGSLADIAHWAPLAAASMLLYAGGMVLNDVFDVEIDRRERPGRPIPSGRFSRVLAGWLGAAGLVLGPLAAWLSGSPASLIVALTLALMILAYDAVLKRTVVGPAAMGTCRSLNLLLGLTHAPALGGPIAWFAAAMYGLFVCGITWISRSETETGKTRNLLLGLTLQDLSVVGLLAASFLPGKYPNAETKPPLIPLEGLLVLTLVALAVNLAASRAIHHPVPALIQKAVKTGIFALIWIDVGLVAAVRGPHAAGAIAVLWIPAFLLGRWLYST